MVASKCRFFMPEAIRNDMDQGISKAQKDPLTLVLHESTLAFGHDLGKIGDSGKLFQKLLQ